MAAARKECIAARRRYTRARKKGRAFPEILAQRWDEYKSARRALKLEINKSKKREWDKLCEEVERDVWGKPYKIVTKRLGKAKAAVPAEMIENIVEHLFPRRPLAKRSQIAVRDYPHTTREEVRAAGSRLAAGKAPGPDGVPPEVVKLLAKECPDCIARVVDTIWESGHFPLTWKRANLVLIPKPGKCLQKPQAYRPICLLDGLAKLVEMIIHKRLADEVDKTRALSDNQYGFRKGRSTVEAVQKVLGTAKGLLKTPAAAREYCLLILLDVKNAFNSADWEMILKALEEKQISPYLRRVLGSYLADRQIVARGKPYALSAGVPQGSILGPILWNLAYNGVLNIRHLPPGTQALAYADDLVILVTAMTPGILERTANDALQAVSQWMSEHKLELAPDKTEAMLLGLKRCKQLNIRLGQHPVKISAHCRYLGVHLDRGLTGRAHTEKVTVKASKVINQILRIMPRLRGASEQKRRLLCSVADAIVTYAAPCWAEEALKYKANRNTLKKCQRRLAIGITRAYRTIPTEAALVLASYLPWDLRLEELLVKKADPTLTRSEIRRRSIAKWQEQWSEAAEEAPGARVRKLLPDITPWVNRTHGRITYYLTQVITGHGNFQTYLHRFKIAPSSTCMHCTAGEEDDVEHTLFKCQAYENIRSLNSWVTEGISMEKVISRMLKSQACWDEALAFITEVMSTKEQLERLRRSRLTAEQVKP